MRSVSLRLSGSMIAAGSIVRRWGSALSDLSESESPGPRRPVPEASGELAIRARDGDARALDALCARYRARLVRWAHGRLPPWARESVATEDVVQETLVSLTRHVGGLRLEAPGALEAYLRTALDNRLRDAMRRARRHPAPAPLPSNEPTAAASPLEEAIGGEAMARYEAALTALPDDVRGLVIARLELEMSYGEIAEAFGRPSADAARMAVSRALVRVAEEMARRG